MKRSILLIEDEPAMRSALTVRLQSNGYLVHTANDGRDGLEMGAKHPFDLIILDVVLPDQVGFDVCLQMRKSGLAIPIMFLTARRTTVDKVLGLKLGADDFVTKPFKFEELLARIEALLRRASVHPEPGIYQFGLISVDLARSEVSRGKVPVPMGRREYQLLKHFIEYEGVAISRADLLRAVWSHNGKSLTRAVDVHVSNLREKLERNPRHPEHILTVSGVGYKFLGSKAL